MFGFSARKHTILYYWHTDGVQAYGRRIRNSSPNVQRLVTSLNTETQNIEVYSSYQMNIWHKVAQHSCGHPKRPNSVCDDVKNTQVEVLLHSADHSAPAGGRLGMCPGLALRFSGSRVHPRRAHASSSWEQRLKGQRQQGLDQHEEAEDLKGSTETQRLHHIVEENREAHGEEAGPSGDYAIGQTQALAEVVAENDQRRLKRKGGAAAK